MTYPNTPAGFAALKDFAPGDADCVILPIPYDMTSSYVSGARFGPQAIIEASRHVETYDDDLGLELEDLRFATLPPLEADSRGSQFMYQRVLHAAQQAQSHQHFVLGLGGEHSVSLGLIEAAQQRFGEIGVLQLDAHLDLREQFEGSPYNHACVMRRVRDDLNLPVQAIGIRSYSSEEQAYLDAQNIPFTSARSLMTRAFSERKNLIAQAIANLPQQVYLSVDLDVFDPAYLPATGTPEPGGLDWYTVLAVVETLAKQQQIISADLVELSPIGGQVGSDFLAAKLALKIIALAHKKTLQERYSTAIGD